jgi:hypothetical protein
MRGNNMRRTSMVVVLAVMLMLVGIGSRSYAADPDMPGGEPKEFNLAILSEEGVSYYIPSAIILDEKGRLNPLELIVTNHTKKEHGFAIDRLKVKEVLKPGESKTIKVSVTDLDAIGTDRSAFKYYCQLHKGHIGGQLYIKR